jgi:vacuolar-type H+-ATPase subunit F/Vma7
MKLSIEKPKRVKEIALLADRRTATLFRLAGLKNVYPVTNPEEIEKNFETVTENPNYQIILVTELILNEIQEKKGDIAEKKYPLIIPIPSLEGPSPIKIDLINQLIKSKAGIEFALE